MHEVSQHPTAHSARRTLGLGEALTLLAQQGLPCVPWVELPSAQPITEENLSALKFPVAVKFDSPHIAHKTAAGGVVLGCTCAAEVESARMTVRQRALAYNPQAEGGTLCVQQMAVGVAECLVGLHRDPVVGAVVVVGTGGVMVELFDDVAIRVLPMGRSDVADMLSQLRGIRLLEGFRGRPRGDREGLERLIRAAAALFLKDPAIVSVDLNPVIVGADGVWIVDAMIERNATETS